MQWDKTVANRVESKRFMPPVERFCVATADLKCNASENRILTLGEPSQQGAAALTYDFFRFVTRPRHRRPLELDRLESFAQVRHLGE